MPNEPTRHTLLIPEAGSDCAMSVVKSIEKAYQWGEQPNIIFIDTDPQSPAAFFKTFYKVPSAVGDNTARKYLDALYQIHEKHGFDIVMPTSDYDVKLLSVNPKYQPWKHTIMSSLKTVLDWEDKLEFANTHPDIHPFTTDDPYAPDYSCFAKPRYGVGSRGIRTIDYVEEALALEQDNEEYIFQELLTGNQYTVDVLCSLEGQPLQAVTREVYRLKGGSDVSTCIVDAPKMEDIAMSLCRGYQVVGAACFEFMLDETGEPKLIDAQPRLSGSHIVTTHAGLNIPEWIIRLVDGESFTKQPIKYGQKIIRRWEEHIYATGNED